MCEYNDDCDRVPQFVLTIGPGEALVDCCGTVVSPSDGDFDSTAERVAGDG